MNDDSIIDTRITSDELLDSIGNINNLNTTMYFGHTIKEVKNGNDVIEFVSMVFKMSADLWCEDLFRKSVIEIVSIDEIKSLMIEQCRIIDDDPIIESNNHNYSFDTENYTHNLKVEFDENRLDQLSVINSNTIQPLIKDSVLYIPKEIKELNIAPAFLKKKGLKGFCVDEQNETFSSVEGVLYDKEKTTLINYPVNKTGKSFTVPDFVDVIGECAFNRDCKLEELIIRNNISSIGQCAIAGNKLKTIYVSGNNLVLNYLSFDDIRKIKLLELQTGVIALRNGAIYSSNIDTLIISETVKLIEKGAFKESKIKKVIVKGAPNRFDSNLFSKKTEVEYI